MHTHRDQRTIDLENRANYLALRQRWQILDKTLQIPNHEPTINDHPSYLEHSDENTCSPSPSNATTRTETDVSSEDKDVLNSLEESLDRSNVVCNSCHKTMTLSSSSLGNSTTTNSESGFSELSNNSSCNCEKTERSETECERSVSGACVQSVGESSEDCGICRDQVGVARVGVAREGVTRRCECEFRSSCENLSTEDEALLKILDFPARVSLHTLLYTSLLFDN